MKVLDGKESPVRSPDFADVYDQHLVEVWRYVRSRIPGHHEAQDVTSDVFTRAWKSWHRFDPGRGPVGAWLFRIAQRAVAEWYRGRTPQSIHEPGEPAMDSDRETPETAVLKEEVLAELGRALRTLSARERDGLALRFAAHLKMPEIGEVLGLTADATKKMISRALVKLAGAMTSIGPDLADAPTPVLLDAVLDDVVARGHPSMPESKLSEMLYHLAVIHEPPLPRELPDRVAACIDCAPKVAGRAAGAGEGAASTGARRLLERAGVAPILSGGWAAFGPVCLLCTVPALVPVVGALGLSLNVAFWLHNVGLGLAPLVFLVMFAHFRRHRDRLSVLVGMAGALLMVLHVVMHFAADGSVAFTVANRGGAALLLAGTLLNWRAMGRWRGRQREALTAALRPAL